MKSSFSLYLANNSHRTCESLVRKSAECSMRSWKRKSRKRKWCYPTCSTKSFSKTLKEAPANKAFRVKSDHSFSFGAVKKLNLRMMTTAFQNKQKIRVRIKKTRNLIFSSKSPRFSSISSKTILIKERKSSKI